MSTVIYLINKPNCSKQTDGRMDGHKKANSCFSNANAPKLYALKFLLLNISRFFTHLSSSNEWYDANPAEDQVK